MSVDDGLGSHDEFAFTCTEDLVVVGREGFRLFSATDGELLRSWGAARDSAGALHGASDMSVSGNRLYVLSSGRVLVYE